MLKTNYFTDDRVPGFLFKSQDQLDRRLAFNVHMNHRFNNENTNVAAFDKLNDNVVIQYTGDVVPELANEIMTKENNLLHYHQMERGYHGENTNRASDGTWYTINNWNSNGGVARLIIDTANIAEM